MTRTAISPRLAIRIFCSTAANVGAVDACRPHAAWPGRWPPGWTVEHVAETGSTNADLLGGAAGRPGSQRAGRRSPDGRPGPARSSLGGAARGEPARVDPVPRRAARPRRADAAGGPGRHRRLPGRSAGVDARAQVAERPAARRAQAGRHPRPASGRRVDRRRPRPQCRLGARRRSVIRRSVIARRRRMRAGAARRCSPRC